MANIKSFNGSLYCYI